MKKSIIALAIAGALAPVMAQAQSNVTLYGRIHESVEQDQYKGARSEFSFKDNASRLGVKGAESLGNGNDAIFGIESQLAADSGTSGLGGQLRNSYVGLKGNSWGGVVLGRLDTGVVLTDAAAPLYNQIQGVWSNVNHDVGFTSYASTAGAVARATTALQGNTFAAATREANAFGYQTPSFGGFVVALRYAHRGPESQNNNTAITSNAAANDFTNTTNGNVARESDITRTQLAGTYKTGGLVVGLGYEKASYKDSSRATGAGNTYALDDRWQVVAGYNFGFVKIGGIVARNNLLDEDTTTTRALGGGGTTTNRSKTNEYGLSLAAPFGAQTVLFNWGQAQLADDSSAKRNQIQLGYQYNLSTRTMLSAYYQTLRLTSNNSEQYTVTENTGSTTVSAPRVNTIGIGVRHNF